VIHTLKGHSKTVDAVAFSPASYDRTVRLWDAATGAAIHTLEVTEAIYDLYFSEHGSSIEAYIGPLRVPGLASAVPHLQPSPLRLSNIRFESKWITRDMERLLWLPPEYRPICSDCSNNILVIGHENGHVSLINFGPE